MYLDRSLMGNDIGTGLSLKDVSFDFCSTNISSSVIGTHSTTKVIHTKYSKHRPSTVTHTFECMCSKINHGLNHGLFISLLKLINCPIH